MGETEQEQEGTVDEQLEETEPEEETSDVTEGDEPEPEPEEPDDLYVKPGTKAWDKAERALQTKVRNYLKGVEDFATATGQPLIVNESSLEHVPGFIFNPQIIPPDDTQKQFAAFLLNEQLLPEFRQSPGAETCDRCGGWGYLLTGSKVEGNKTIPCRVCQAQGWVGDDKSVPPSAFVPPPAANGAETVTFAGVHTCVNCGQVFGSPSELASHLTAGVCQRPTVVA